VPFLHFVYFCTKIRQRWGAGKMGLVVGLRTNEAEFFSVISEYFFQQPHLLEKHHPALFCLLEKIFKHQHQE